MSTEHANARYSPYSTPRATREVLERHGLYTKYGLGQNFLVNDDVIRKIIELADVRPDDRILEVGPGIGTLTAALLPRAAHVTAVEKDTDLPAVLADTLAPWADRFTLITADALDLVDPASPASPANRADPASPTSPTSPTNPANPTSASLASPAVPASLTGPASASLASTAGPASPARSTSPTPPPNKLVSNLPYAVAATVVLDYLERFAFLESATVMVQKEVADRMTARPATKAYGAYTVKLSMFAQPAGRFAVSPGSFFPPPHVESAVLRLNRIDPPKHARAACIMADAAFATRRKTIANSCKTHFANRPDIQAAVPAILERAGIDPRRRGESLTREEFLLLGAAAELTVPQLTA